MGRLNLRFGYHVAANNYRQVLGRGGLLHEPGAPEKKRPFHVLNWPDRMTLPAGIPLHPVRWRGRIAGYELRLPRLIGGAGGHPVTSSMRQLKSILPMLAQVSL